MAEEKMAEENKELIKRDLSIIKKLHQKTDYTQTNNIKVIYDYVISKDLLKTNLGKKYLNKLSSLKEGINEDNACIICGKLCDHNPLVCNHCNKKLLNTKQDQSIQSQGKIPERAPEKEVEKKTEDIAEKLKASTMTEDISTKPIASTADKDKMIVKPKKEGKDKDLKKKNIWNTLGSIMLILLLFFYTVEKIGELQDNKDSISSSDTNTSDTNSYQQGKTNESDLVGDSTVDIEYNEEDITLPAEETIGDENSEQDNIIESTEGNVKINKDEHDNCFDFTVEELMGQIQESLLPDQLDIGTKKDDSNIYYVLEGDTASNVVYQVAMNEDLKVQTISINILAPVETLDVYSKAVIAATLSCDPTITYNEINSLIDMIGSQEFITINDINYVAGPLSDNMLSFLITKADIPEELDADSSGIDHSNMYSDYEDNLEDVYVEPEAYDLSTLLGKTAEEVQLELGYPLDKVDNTEYYSDFLSIVYENELATKIILGLEERYDFTQIEIPEMIYTIDGIHLGDAKETVLDSGEDIRLFILDGVFYGSTYEIEQDGYYVIVDFFTLEDNEEYPVYRIVLTRLLPVN